MDIKHIINKRNTKEKLEELRVKFTLAFDDDFKNILGSYQLLKIKVDSVCNNDRYGKVVNRFMRTKINDSVDELDKLIESLKSSINKKKLKIMDLYTIHIQVTSAYKLMYAIRDYLLDVQELYMIDELEKYS